jgi:hypothetical protein
MIRGVHRSQLLLIAGAVGAATTASGALADSDTMPLGHVADRGTTVTLTAARTPVQKSPYRDVSVSTEVHLPSIQDDDGEITDMMGSTGILARLTERTDRPVYLETYAVNCRITVFAGSALRAVDHITLLRSDETSTRLRLRQPPKSWHYNGHFIGSIVVSDKRLIFARPFDRDGHVMRPIRLATKRC